MTSFLLQSISVKDLIEMSCCGPFQKVNLVGIFQLMTYKKIVDKESPGIESGEEFYKKYSTQIEISVRNNCSYRYNSRIHDPRCPMIM